MDSPIRPPPRPPPPPTDPRAPSSPPSQQHPAVDPSRDESLSPEENPTPGPPPGPTTPSPPHRSGDSKPASPLRAPAPPPPPSGPTTPTPPHRSGNFSPTSPTHDPAPPPPLPGPTTRPSPHRSSDSSPASPTRAPDRPPGPTTPPPHRSGDSSPASHPQSPAPPPPPTSGPCPPPLPEDQTQLPRPPSPPAPVPSPSPSPPPAPSSSGGRLEHEEAESASEAGSMTLALALTQTEETMPPKAATAEASPVGSPCKESAVTIAKLLSGEDPAAMEAKPAADKVAPPSDNGTLAAAAVTIGGGGAVGSMRWLLGGDVPEKVRRAELRRAELGFRVSAAVFCLISLSVMAADTTPGWSGDSFRRYTEYRYVLAVSVVAFTYSGFQLVAEVHYLVTGRRIIPAPFRSYFNLAMDQILAYLLLSASSAALSRNDVWISRFGGDQFTKLVNASASMAFLAFIALGLSSIISSYCIFSSIS